MSEIPPPKHGRPWRDGGYDRDEVEVCPHHPDLTEDRHQQALYRLSAAAQYLYDTMNGDHRSSETGVRPPDPLPQMAMERVREAQIAIEDAIKHGQRTRRRCLGGELELHERPGPQCPDTHENDDGEEPKP